MYDPLSSRRPAWTDRILHHVLVHAYEHVQLSVQQSGYAAHQQYTQSDHKPVSADYAIKVGGLPCCCLNTLQYCLVGATTQCSTVLPCCCHNTVQYCLVSATTQCGTALLVPQHSAAQYCLVVATTQCSTVLPCCCHNTVQYCYLDSVT